MAIEVNIAAAYWFFAALVMGATAIVFGMMAGRYQNFVNNHLKKSQEFFDWNKKRKETNEW